MNGAAEAARREGRATEGRIARRGPGKEASREGGGHGMSEPTAETEARDARQAAYGAARGRLSRDAGGVDAPRRSDAAVFQDLAAAGDFTPGELREAVEGMGLLRMSHAAPADFAAVAKEVGAEVRGMGGPAAVAEVVRAIMSGAKNPKKKGEK
jgi:hypothetical protein